jgi:hypothetical protein
VRTIVQAAVPYVRLPLMLGACLDLALFMASCVVLSQATELPPIWMCGFGPIMAWYRAGIFILVNLLL